jgi:hypothetical protein
VKAELCLAVIGALALAGALTACQDKKQPAASSHATAVGEVLPGSASDAMLPVDTVRSQPPLAPRVEASEGKPDKAHASDKPAPDSAIEAQPAAEPPAEQSPAPPPAE